RYPRTGICEREPQLRFDGMRDHGARCCRACHLLHRLRGSRAVDGSAGVARCGVLLACVVGDLTQPVVAVGARRMRPGIASGAIWKVEPWEYCVRFLFGGAVTLGTGIIAHAWGPEIGGLFLAFPAILPASLTLVKRHDGCPPVIAGARGACLGAVAL